MNASLEAKVIEEDMRSTLFFLKIQKRQCLHGESIEFYINFYYLIKVYLLKVFIESQQSCKILSSLNSTFIALIPNNPYASSYKELCPISYCIVIYKFVSKVISLIIKSILSEVVFEEQFGFLQGHKIHDVGALA
jgi:hypothetical protein